MAYKFQIGAAKLSGSVQLTDGSVVSSSVDDTTAANVVSQIDAGEIPIAKLAASTISGKSLGNNLDSLSVDDSSIEFSSGGAFNGSSPSTIQVKDLGITNAMLAGSIANAKLANSTISGVALGSNLNSLSRASNSGLAMTSYNGSAAVSDLKVDITALADGAIADGDFLAFADATDGATKVEAVADLAALFAGDGLTASNSVMAVNVDDSSIETNSDAIRIKASGVTNAMLAGSIANAKLANSSITVGGSASSLGGSVSGAQIANALNSNLGGNFTIGSQSGHTATFSGGVIIAGDLTVQGSAVEIQQGFVVTSSVAFEGATNDGNEITLTSADPSADRTITLPDLTGHIPLIAGAIGNANVTAAEFLLLDGGSSVGTDALADADGFMHNDDGTMKQTQVIKIAELAFSKISGDATVNSSGALTIEASAVEASMLNDNVVSGLDDIGAAITDTDEMIVSDAGTIKRMDMSRIKTYIGAGTVSVTPFGDANATLVKGINVASANTSAARTLTLPASNTVSAGDSVKVKVAGVSSGAVTIQRNGTDQSIDGNLSSIVLESDNAAVEFIYMGNDDWRIF